MDNTIFNKYIKGHKLVINEKINEDIVFPDNIVYLNKLNIINNDKVRIIINKSAKIDLLQTNCDVDIVGNDCQIEITTIKMKNNTISFYGINVEYYIDTIYSKHINVSRDTYNEINKVVEFLTKPERYYIKVKYIYKDVEINEVENNVFNYYECSCKKLTLNIPNIRPLSINLHTSIKYININNPNFDDKFVKYLTYKQSRDSSLKVIAVYPSMFRHTFLLVKDNFIDNN